ncbi:hypothetical protein [Kitasatospora sp. SUK 42]|uniref:hypothetical protein n=1 Tax=Kitasatospora sp. SUK 42 TaxID=1588882 RepID=UPI0018CB6164|nr:hypothetical protein [Kitasatospora sp. SUK 42]MBV2153399.1 hypothetical protein [Kitasatospora sp. SUK 42]
MSTSTGVVRRRGSLAVVWAVLLVAVVAPPLAVGPAFAHSAALLLPGLVAAMGPAVLLRSGTARRKSWRADGTLVRARTWTGVREVDLAALAIVRGWVLPRRSGPLTYVSVADRSGRRVILDVDDRGLKLVADAVRHHGADYLSSWALTILGLAPAHRFASVGRQLGLGFIALGLLLIGMLLAAAIAQC